MSYLGTRDFGLEVALGKVSGYSTNTKFGLAPDCDNGVPTDIWDGADGTTSTDIWVAPTQARTHDIASTSANDTSAGTGARTIRVQGLTDWDTAEVSEDVTLNGTSNVATANEYVIIHRKRCLTFGSGGTNAGIITATAQTDGTVTAAIQAGEGQTLMLIYGVPSVQSLTVRHVYGTILKASGAPTVAADITFLLKQNADQSDSGFVTKGRWQMSNSVPLDRAIDPPTTFTGPLIAKIQANADANDSQVTMAFDAYLVDN